MKVRATMTAVLEYEIDSSDWSSVRKNKALGIEKACFELNPAGFVTQPNTEVQIKIEEAE